MPRVDLKKISDVKAKVTYCDKSLLHTCILIYVIRGIFPSLSKGVPTNLKREKQVQSM